MSVKSTIGRAFTYADLFATTVFSGGVRQTTLAGERVLFDVRNRKELKRAKNGLREGAQMAWLMQDVDDDAVFWDVGAYQGHYAVVAASKGATVRAFEPHPDNCVRINEHADLNGVDVHVERRALSDGTDTRRIGGPVRSECHLGDGKHMVKAIPGDSVSIQPTHVKIDVEGHECAVLDGMELTLPDVERIMAEVHNDVSVDDVTHRLQRAGLSVKELPTSRSQSYVGGWR